MKSKLLAGALLIGALAVLSCFAPPPETDNSRLNKYYEKGRAFFEQGEVDSAEVYAEKCLTLSRQYAPANHLLGEIYLLRDGIINRRLSALSLREAVRADRQNPEYHFALGQTLEKQGFLPNALEEYRAAAGLDSTNSRPLIRIAEINKKLGLRYDDAKYFRRSVEASSKAASLLQNPAYYYQEALALYQMKSYDSAQAALQQALAMGDTISCYADCLMLKGTILVWQGEYDSANAAFTAARERIGPLARDDMDDVRYVMGGVEYKNMMAQSFYQQGKTIKGFWGQLDPDPTTGINERQLIHYARFTHAQVTYSLPEKAVPGWKTKRGEMYIRYGAPDEAVFSLGDAAEEMPRWSWTYNKLAQPVTFIFEDTFLNGDFDFPFPNKNWTADDYARDPARLADELGDATPQTFTFQPGSGPLAYFFMPRQFKGTRGKTDLEVFVAIPYKELQFQRNGEYATATIAWREALRFMNWQMADSTEAIRSYNIRASQTDNPDLTLSDRLALREYPDSLVFSISIRDTLSDHVGISARQLRLRDFYTGKVEISDIVLARRIDQPPGQPHFFRKELDIYSNLENSYFAGEPIWLYFEIYNLQKGDDGKTSYTIKQTLAQKRGGGVLGTIKNAINGKTLKEIETSYSGASIYGDENRILQVDASQLEAGRYSLILEVNDLISGKSSRVAEDVVIYR